MTREYQAVGDRIVPFIELLGDGFNAAANTPEGKALSNKIFARNPAVDRPARETGRRLPACEHLEAAIALTAGDDRLQALLAAFLRIEPGLDWVRGQDRTGTGSANFAEGHAEASIIGKGGIIDHPEIWIGVTIMAPHVRYPDHEHPPEEIYLVASPGEFFHGDSGWFTPGPNGSFYNRPGILHGMNSGAEPLLAFWALHR